MNDKKTAILGGVLGGIGFFLSSLEIFRWADTQAIGGAKFEVGFWMWIGVLSISTFVAFFSASRIYTNLTGRKEVFDVSPRISPRKSIALLFLLTIVVVVVIVSVLSLVADM